MSVDYIERSAAIIRSLDPQAINDGELGEIVSEDNSSARYALGSIATCNRSVYLAVELPTARRLNAAMLFHQSMVFTAYIAERFPDLVPNLPPFYGALVAAENKSFWPQAVLLEDLTQDGRLPVQTASDTLKETLTSRGLMYPPREAERGGLKTVVDPQTGTERMVSTPSFTLTFEEYDRIGDRFRWQASDPLRVPLGKESKLSRSLKRVPPRV